MVLKSKYSLFKGRKGPNIDLTWSPIIETLWPLTLDNVYSALNISVLQLVWKQDQAKHGPDMVPTWPSQGPKKYKIHGQGSQTMLTQSSKFQSSSWSGSNIFAFICLSQGVSKSVSQSVSQSQYSLEFFQTSAIDNFSKFSFQILFNYSILSHTPAGHTYETIFK